jgi:hypothetical protein
MATRADETADERGAGGAEDDRRGAQIQAQKDEEGTSGSFRDGKVDGAVPFNLFISTLSEKPFCLRPNTDRLSIDA